MTSSTLSIKTLFGHDCLGTPNSNKKLISETNKNRFFRNVMLTLLVAAKRHMKLEFWQRVALDFPIRINSYLVVLSHIVSSSYFWFILNEVPKMDKEQMRPSPPKTKWYGSWPFVCIRVIPVKDTGTLHVDVRRCASSYVDLTRRRLLSQDLMGFVRGWNFDSA